MSIRLYPLLILVALWGCKKEDDRDCRVMATQYFDENGGLLASGSYEYDAAGRVIKTPVSTIRYFKDSVTVEEANSITTYLLNASGLGASSGTRFTSMNPNGLSFDHVYTYNSEGYLVQVQEIFSQSYYGSIIRDTSFYFFTIQNGNMVKSTSSASGFETVYEYGPQILNPNIAFLIKAAYPWDFLGKPSKNLVAKISLAGNIIVSYSYGFDSKGNIVKQKQNQGGSGSVAEIRYRYTCQ